MADGQVALSRKSFPFADGVDRETGRVTDGNCELFDSHIKGKVLVFPKDGGGNSEAGSLLELGKNGCAPISLVMEECDSALASAALSQGMPVVDGIEVDLFRNDDEVVVNGGEGIVTLKNVELKPVVTSFLRHNGLILILKRSDKVRTSKGRWAGVSGYVEEGEKPEETALKEIGEETGMANPVLVKKGGSFRVRTDDTIFQIHTFLFDVDTDVVTIDWEHTEYRWIEPEDIEKYDTVPKLPKSLRSILLHSP